METTDIHFRIFYIVVERLLFFTLFRLNWTEATEQNSRLALRNRKVRKGFRSWQINVNEVKESLKGEIDRRLGDLEGITLFKEEAPVLNINIVVESKPVGKDFINTTLLNANLENKGKKWIFEYKCKTDKPK